MKEDIALKNGQSYQTLIQSEGWKNLNKWFEYQMQACANAILTKQPKDFNIGEHHELVGMTKMIRLIIEHINQAIKLYESKQTGKEEVKDGKQTY